MVFWVKDRFIIYYLTVNNKCVGPLRPRAYFWHDMMRINSRFSIKVARHSIGKRPGKCVILCLQQNGNSCPLKPTWKGFCKKVTGKKIIGVLTPNPWYVNKICLGARKFDAYQLLWHVVWLHPFCHKLPRELTLQDAPTLGVNLEIQSRLYLFGFHQAINKALLSLQIKAIH